MKQRFIEKGVGDIFIVLTPSLFEIACRMAAVTSFGNNWNRNSRTTVISA
jgi:hypothetical protein